MEDVTDPSFRRLCKEFGADMVTTEFVSSDGLFHGAEKTFRKLNVSDTERPVAIQIYGHLIEPMVEAARLAEKAGPDVIDINFGCPMKKIAGRGAGSGMMKDVPLMVEMTRRIVEAVKLPVTVKTRLGWDDDNKNIVVSCVRAVLLSKRAFLEEVVLRSTITVIDTEDTEESGVIKILSARNITAKKCPCRAVR